MQQTERDLIPVESPDDIPDFANEDEEHEFWSTHSFGELLLAEMGPLDDVLPPPQHRRHDATAAGDFVRAVGCSTRTREHATRPVLDISRRGWLRAS